MPPPTTSSKSVGVPLFRDGEKKDSGPTTVAVLLLSSTGSSRAAGLQSARPTRGWTAGVAS